MNSKIFNFSIISKFLICFLCCLMLFSLVSRPITARASAVGALISVAGGAGVSVSWPIVAVALVIVGVGAAVNLNSEQLKAKAIEWYESSAILSAWADYAGPRIEAGDRTISIPNNLQEWLKNKFNNNNQPDEIPYLFVPGTLTSLGSLTATDIFGLQLTDALSTSNELLAQSNTLLGTISSSLSSGITNLRNKLMEFHTDVGAALTTLNNNIMNRLDGVKTGIADMTGAIANHVDVISQVLVNFRAQVQTSIEESREAMAYRIENVGLYIQSLPDSIANAFRGFIATLDASITEGLTSVRGSIATNVTSAITTINELKSAVASRIDYISQVISGLKSDVISSLEDSRAALAYRIENVGLYIQSLPDAIANSLRGFVFTLDAAITESAINIRSSIATNIEAAILSLNELKASVTYRIDHVSQVITGFKTDLITSIEDSRDSFVSHIKAIAAELITLPDNIADSFVYLFNRVITTIEENLLTVRQSFATKITDLQTTVNEFKSAIAYRVDAVSSAVTSFKNTFVSHIETITTKITALPGAISSSLQSSFASLETAIREAFANGAVTTPPNDSKPSPEEEDLFNKVEPGKQVAIGAIGHGKDLLSRYAAGFLAVGGILSKFIALPVIGDLIDFSLALGIFALVVNLANMIVSKDSSDARGKRRSTAKGG